MAYRVNEDGSVTRNTSTTSSTSGTTSAHSGGSNDNTGCWITLFIAIIIGIFVFVIANKNSKSSHEPEYLADTIEAISEIHQEPSYISVSSTSASFDADGGTYEFSVSSNDSWYISTDTDTWGHIYKSGDKLTLRVDANESTESRTDYFILSTSDKSVRVNISQEGKKTSSASIRNVWMTHNEYQNGVKGMTIHAKITTENLRNQLIYVKAQFYYDDNSTPLHDPYGNNLIKTVTSYPSYDSAIYEDFIIFIPYDWLNMEQGGGTCTLSFDISVHDSNGTQLDIDENTQFEYTSR